jgi:hypothetical protein
MMGVQAASAQLFYDFCLDDHVPSDHLLRSIDGHLDFEGFRQTLKPFYSRIGRPSIDPALMIRMLMVGYCMGLRSERRLCEEVHRLRRPFPCMSGQHPTFYPRYGSRIEQIERRHVSNHILCHAGLVSIRFLPARLSVSHCFHPGVSQGAFRSRCTTPEAQEAGIPPPAAHEGGSAG